MAHFFGLLLGTALLRPYVFLFFAVYLAGCTLQFGLKRTLLFAVAGYLIAWGSEVSSIHNGFPYGLYYYIESTAGREIWVKGVPLMDSASYVFLAYASYSTALLAFCPLLRGKGFAAVALLDTRRARALPSVRALAALLFVSLDIIIDPVALRGGRWFLGKIYGYPGGGAYFGVPVSNFLGWAAVGYLMTWAFQALDGILYRFSARDIYGRGLPWRFFIGPALYLSVLLFNLSITFYIGEYNIGWAGVFIMLPLFWLFRLLAGLQTRQADDNAISLHLRDFPGSLTGILTARQGQGPA
ncbi:MAG: carotenoid biosynthesis protein [Nitrospiraceae bacterium]|nr:carotenoid biosynthesis protein [Nitrospiraceae bacterium]